MILFSVLSFVFDSFNVEKDCHEDWNKCYIGWSSYSWFLSILVLIPKNGFESVSLHDWCDADVDFETRQSKSKFAMPRISDTAIKSIRIKLRVHIHPTGPTEHLPLRHPMELHFSTYSFEGTRRHSTTWPFYFQVSRVSCQRAGMWKRKTTMKRQNGKAEIDAPMPNQTSRKLKLLKFESHLSDDPTREQN